MQSKKHYSLSPITEALIDIQVQLPPEVRLDNLVQVYTEVHPDYPHHEGIFVLQGEMIAGASVQARASQSQVGYRLFSSDKKQIIQIRLDGFSFSRLAPYDCWERFRDETSRIWRIYKTFTKPENIIRLAIRYINRLDIPLPVSDLKLYLRTLPEVSPNLPQELSGYFMQLQIPQENLATMLINQAIVPPPTKEFVSVLLDFELFLENNIPNDEVSIWETLEQMHTQINQAFEACITEHTRELIN